MRRKLTVGLSERVDLAIQRATDADPAKRPATCAEFLKLLRVRSRTTGTPKPDVRSSTLGGDEATDRRACVRYALGVGSSCTINTSVFGTPLDGEFAEEEVWPLVVKDVSANGIGILLARRCEPGTELAIELATGTGSGPRCFPVRVVRVRRDNLGHWLHGCTFHTPLEEPALAALLWHLGRSTSA